MIYAYVPNTTKTIGLNEQIGSLVSGKHVDLTMLGHDVLFDTQGLKTYFGGK